MPILIIILSIPLAVLAAVIAFLIMPRVKYKPEMSLICCDYAHRGLHSGRKGQPADEVKIPENSLAAFELAVRANYGIELDVRLTRDKKVVVFHDDNLFRMCGIDKKVADLTLAEIKTLRLAGTDQTIPTFEEVLRLVEGKVPLLVEMKADTVKNASLCIRTSKLLDFYPGVFAVQSFNPFILRWFRYYRPHFARGQLFGKAPEEAKEVIGKFLRFALANLLLNFISRPDFISADKLYVNKITVRILRKIFKTRAFVWTVVNGKEYEICRRKGFCAIFEYIRP